MKGAKALNKALKALKKYKIFFPLNELQIGNLNRFIKKIPKNSKNTLKITKLKNKSIEFKATSKSKNIPGSYAEYKKVVDKNGKTIEYTKSTYNSNGDIIHVKNKLKLK